MRRIVISAAALDDIDDIRGFYEARDEGSGDYFFESIRREVASLGVLHGIHRRLGGLFQMNAPNFPHHIYYRDMDDETRVVADLDQRRDPKWIRDQLCSR
jgi:plasmid stabilization system protein ParE